MTLYLVKHGAEDFRLHQDDGTQLSTSQSAHPDQRDMVDLLADEHDGASILGDPVARLQYTDVVTGAVRYRDLTIDDETVPWQ